MSECPPIRGGIGLAAWLALAGLTLAGIGVAPPAAHAWAERVLRIVAAPDEEFREHPGWEETVRSTVQQVSDRMEVDFSLEIRIARIEPWTSAAPDYDLSALRVELKRQIAFGADEDLVVGFCGRVTPGTERRVMRLGQSDTPGRAIAVSDLAGRDLALVLRHELAHAFGVPHVNRVPSLMNADLSADRATFDSGSAAILRNNLRLDFQSDDPFAGVRLEILQGLYEELAQGGDYVADLISTIGDSYRARNENDAAESTYRRALELDPDLVSPHLGQAGLALAEERFSEAAREFERVREERPETPHLNLNLGLAYAGLNQIGNARAAYERALQIDPQDVGALNNLGLLDVDDQQYGRAEKLFRRALAADPRYAEAWNNLGMVYGQTEQPDRAIDALTEALALADTPTAHRNMAAVLLGLGRLPEARAHLMAARQLTAEAAAAANESR